MRATRIRAAALLLLRFALPVCVLAASCVAVFGLFRDVSQPAAQAASEPAPSLRLGSGSGAASPSPVPSPSPSRSPAPAASPEPLTAPVEIFNASGVTGLATRTAAQLRLRGITVAAIGNLTAAPQPAAGTAVYYPPGSRSQAQTLAHLLGAETIAPAPNGFGSAGTLVLVLTVAKSAASAALTSNVP